MLINCTPHDINILNDVGNVVKTVSPSGVVARVEEMVTSVEFIEGVTCVEKGYGAVTNLPVKTEGFTYIVSYLVLQALKGTRPDCICPDTGPESVVRENGKVKGVRRFQR